MTTFTALTTLPDAAAAQALATALENLDPGPTGIGVFEVEDGSGTWEVGGYFNARPDIAGLLLLATMHNARPFAVSKVEDRDWVAQVRRELVPVEAGRFVVFGSHDEDRVPAHKTRIKIDAAMAFGTGHHGTTLGCLTVLDRMITAGLCARNVADIGTGTGVLAMAAAKTWPAEIIASDIDPVATATAAANMTANGLGRRIRCVTSTGFRHQALRDRAPYDLIFANILANPLKKLSPDMFRHTGPGAALTLSGILNRQAQGVISVFAGNGFQLSDRIVIGEWTTLVLRRR